MALFGKKQTAAATREGHVVADLSELEALARKGEGLEVWDQAQLVSATRAGQVPVLRGFAQFSLGPGSVAIARDNAKTYVSGDALVAATEGAAVYGFEEAQVLFDGMTVGELAGSARGVARGLAKVTVHDRKDLNGTTHEVVDVQLAACSEAQVVARGRAQVTVSGWANALLLPGSHADVSGRASCSVEGGAAVLSGEARARMVAGIGSVTARDQSVVVLSAALEPDARPTLVSESGDVHVISPVDGLVVGPHRHFDLGSMADPVVWAQANRLEVTDGLVTLYDSTPISYRAVSNQGAEAPLLHPGQAQTFGDPVRLFLHPPHFISTAGRRCLAMKVPLDAVRLNPHSGNTDLVYVDKVAEPGPWELPDPLPWASWIGSWMDRKHLPPVFSDPAAR